jgi:hypothetical protein
MGKKLPMIHSKIVVRVRRSGPTKRNMPLHRLLSRQPSK